MDQTYLAKYLLMLADLVLSNKLVLYDLESQAIGWTDYNCKIFVNYIQYIDLSLFWLDHIVS